MTNLSRSEVVRTHQQDLPQCTHSFTHPTRELLTAGLPIDVHVFSLFSRPKRWSVVRRTGSSCAEVTELVRWHLCATRLRFFVATLLRKAILVFSLAERAASCRRWILMTGRVPRCWLLLPTNAWAVHQDVRDVKVQLLLDRPPASLAVHGIAPLHACMQAFGCLSINWGECTYSLKGFKNWQVCWAKHWKTIIDVLLLMSLNRKLVKT